MGAPARAMRSIWVARVGVGHRLHRHGMRAADRAGADADFVRRAAPVLRKVDHLFPVL